ncbi:MAG: tetratricopeptide repeat protein [Chitinophagaceae bacterium]|nr:MAG: tetratricopeptide repeat protein [Chitinophagaceae bacterium]
MKLSVSVLICTIFFLNSFAQNNATEAAYRHYILGQNDKALAEINKAVSDSYFNVRAYPWLIQSLILISSFEEENAKRFGNPNINNLKDAWFSLQAAIKRDRSNQYLFQILSNSEKIMLLIDEWSIKHGLSAKIDDRLVLYQVYMEIYDFLKKRNYRNTPNQGIAQYGKILQEEGSTERALNLYNELIKNNTRNPEIYLAAVQIHKIKGDFEAAFETVRKGTAVVPSDNDLLAEAVNIAHYLGRENELIEDLTKLIKSFPNEKGLYFIKASLLSGFNKFEDAILYYKKAIEIDKDFFDANYNLGVLYYNKAIEINEIKTNRNLNPEEENNFLQQRNSYYSMALPYFLKARDLNPNNQSLEQAITLIQNSIKN